MPSQQFSSFTSCWGCEIWFRLKQEVIRLKEINCKFLPFQLLHLFALLEFHDLDFLLLTFLQVVCMPSAPPGSTPATSPASACSAALSAIYQVLKILCYKRGTGVLTFSILARYGFLFFSPGATSAANFLSAGRGIFVLFFFSPGVCSCGSGGGYILGQL